MSEGKEPVYTEEDWDRAREEIRRHDEEKLIGLRCPCGYNYKKGEGTYRHCPYCGEIGPGHPDAELVDLPEVADVE